MSLTAEEIVDRFCRDNKWLNIDKERDIEGVKKIINYCTPERGPEWKKNKKNKKNKRGTMTLQESLDHTAKEAIRQYFGRYRTEEDSDIQYRCSPVVLDELFKV